MMTADERVSLEARTSTIIADLTDQERLELAHHAVRFQLAFKGTTSNRHQEEILAAFRDMAPAAGYELNRLADTAQRLILGV